MSSRSAAADRLWFVTEEVMDAFSLFLYLTFGNNHSTVFNSSTVSIIFEHIQKVYIKACLNSYFCRDLKFSIVSYNIIIIRVQLQSVHSQLCYLKYLTCRLCIIIKTFICWKKPRQMNYICIQMIEL